MKQYLLSTVSMHALEIGMRLYPKREPKQDAFAEFNEAYLSPSVAALKDLEAKKPADG